ncbi:hypothetical protein AO1008_01989 [Aspergillus oryzae 100-8]|uniref:Uncharacterized protein n=1 Tax=Aspergillus oryzae (strain 3.042) TaxID=1160506 RepID=I8TM02_ASPO3|nr:hypothetical protein Ao3042_08735 [Aspergillus oryzae 3.042]KDE76198.1 hypothetical protein AO1008_01989 [Aspergillus oryzae 100-8]|eukprot:EIT74938.1 hypothetical protein Ao3042_08735 [Aspergillus oryzae 3.042]
MEFPDILVDTPRPARHDDEIVTSPVTHCSDTIQRPVLLNYQLSIGSLPSSPVYLLNSKLNATILDECLVRIHDTIVTGCASRFIGYECNLYKPGHRYQLEEDGGDSPQDQKPVSIQNDIELCPNLSADVTSTITAVGRFKEVFGSFLDYCIENLGFLSMRSRLSSGASLIWP